MLAYNTVALEPVARMSKDVRNAAAVMSDNEARYLVDSYYQMQENRIRAENQLRSMLRGQRIKALCRERGCTEEEAAAIIGDAETEPNSCITWLADSMSMVESQIKGALGNYAKHHPMGEWLLSQVGIGPVIAAGLLAHIDIDKAQTAGAIWRYAGLDPSVKWEKGQKRPWNASLKTLCWKIGESFVKVSGKDNAVYGKIYQQAKQRYAEMNESGQYGAAAEEKAKIVGKSTDAYKAYSVGKLPPAHIHSRATRYAVKMFLSHLFEVWYEKHHGKKAPAPFAIAILGHAHKVEPIK